VTSCWSTACGRRWRITTAPSRRPRPSSSRHAARALFARTGVEPEAIDHVVVGNVMQTSPDAIYGARHVGVVAGVPKERPALTVNRLCGSGIEAILIGARLHPRRRGDDGARRRHGEHVAGAARHLGRAAGLQARPGQARGLADAALFDAGAAATWRRPSNNLARDYGISREEQDAFALESQRLRRRHGRAAGCRRRSWPVEVGRASARARSSGRPPAAGHHDGGARQAADGVRQTGSSPPATPRGSSTARR
jgi:acetyl-CoA acetyltransferase